MTDLRPLAGALGVCILYHLIWFFFWQVRKARIEQTEGVLRELMHHIQMEIPAHYLTESTMKGLERRFRGILGLPDGK